MIQLPWFSYFVSDPMLYTNLMKNSHIGIRFDVEQSDLACQSSNWFSIASIKSKIRSTVWNSIQ